MFREAKKKHKTKQSDTIGVSKSKKISVAGQDQLKRLNIEPRGQYHSYKYHAMQSIACLYTCLWLIRSLVDPTLAYPGFQRILFFLIDTDGWRRSCVNEEKNNLWSQEYATSFPCEKSVQNLNWVTDWILPCQVVRCSQSGPLLYC